MLCTKLNSNLQKVQSETNLEQECLKRSSCLWDLTTSMLATQKRFRSRPRKSLTAKQPTLSCRIQTPGLLLGLVMEFPPLFFTKPWVFSFSHPWLLSCPWFSLFPTLGCYSALGFPLFPSLATIQPLVFHFYPPLAKILSFVYNISTLGFSFFSTLGYYSALGFQLLPTLG